ncbi:1-aminocyclopropane-1-carboxylate deaminase [Allocatelliglobosispora scoriae]|uniref:1-aminocyclopropane-1-carboxylate deaminase n=1 Tax=Allocatelliglobosispora scoriae TaxID=643052 RepID=A0A841BTT4_9ACTN|nr:pyridoxal-phosphate dependent enzyme [Allocatelliglobosispora scoriae]MBB5872497.1 1-aminocyclopropane-1-carboxylate deaminase [Allocatelliglobosispora scoriae]
MFEPHLPAPVESLNDERLDRAGVTLRLQRDDLIHSEIPGNKWRKLHLNLAAATEAGHSTLLTFGGAFSNHLRAVAAAGRIFGFATIGIVRGEEHLPLNPSLRYCADQGMTLAYLDRTTYRTKRDPAVEAELRRRWGEFFLIPEGGSNPLAVRGCLPIAAGLGGADVICCPVGTGGTLAGLAAGLAGHQRAIGFAVLKPGDFLTAEVEALQRATFGERSGHWRVESRYHFGGYAKSTPALAAFIEDFHTRHGLHLDRVYVAKMLAGVFDLVESGYFPPGTRLAAIITG